MYAAGRTYYYHVILNTFSWKVNWKKKKLPSLWTTYNLSHTLNIATRIEKDSRTATNNIFVANCTLKLPSTSPIINCLSNHDAQIITIKNIYATINNHEISDMTKQKETWESVYNDKYPNQKF
jgi:cobalamin biosynthesis Co2+ chelatase CbiK